MAHGTTWKISGNIYRDCRLVFQRILHNYSRAQLWLDFTVFHFEHTTSIKAINQSGIITVRKRQFFTNINTWSLGGLYIINISWGLRFRFRKFWKTNSSIMPKLLTVMARGLPSSTEVSVTLITVHTTPVATCSGPEVDSRVLLWSCPGCRGMYHCELTVHLRLRCQVLHLGIVTILNDPSG